MNVKLIHFLLGSVKLMAYFCLVELKEGLIMYIQNSIK